MGGFEGQSTHGIRREKPGGRQHGVMADAVAAAVVLRSQVAGQALAVVVVAVITRAAYLPRAT